MIVYMVKWPDYDIFYPTLDEALAAIKADIASWVPENEDDMQALAPGELTYTIQPMLMDEAEFAELPEVE